MLKPFGDMDFEEAVAKWLAEDYGLNELEAKKNKDFKLADDIRAELLEKGIILEDTRQGTKWKRA